MPKIITVTLNTAIDHCLTLATLNSSDALLAEDSQEFAAGKGINVAKALASLGCTSQALGWVGQQHHSLFESLHSPTLQTQFLSIAGKTRSNLTLRALNPAQEIHIRTQGYSVNLNDCTRFLELLQQRLEPDDLVILSGSLPPGCPEDFYAALIHVCHQQQAVTLLDSSGRCLAEGIPAKPDYLKPNLSELETLVGERLPDIPSIIQASQALLHAGIRQIIVSLGAEGILHVTREHSLHAYIAVATTPVSTIGCGDALVAGWAYAMLHPQPEVDPVKFALCCATANLWTLEPGRLERHKVQSYLAQVRACAYPTAK